MGIETLLAIMGFVLLAALWGWVEVWTQRRRAADPTYAAAMQDLPCWTCEARHHGCAGYDADRCRHETEPEGTQPHS